MLKQFVAFCRPHRLLLLDFDCAAVTVHIPGLQAAALAEMLGSDDPFRAAAMRSRP